MRGVSHLQTASGAPAGDAALLRAARELPARVDQVARVLGIEALDVVGRLVVGGKPAVAARATLPGSQVLSLLDPVPPRRSFRTLEPLLLDAFPRTVDGEFKPITTAVFKNRLIDLTRDLDEANFDEADYGVPTVRAFVRLFPERLLAIEDGRSTMVQAVDQATAASDPKTALGRQRIRPDLWRAALDYASGLPYVWDSTSAVARPSEPSDGTLPPFPTLTPEQLAGWRQDYIATIAEPSEDLTAWARNNGKTAALPPELRSGWNRLLSERVVEHIRRTLTELGDADVSVFEEYGVPRSATPSSLRAFMHRYIDTASEQELAAMTINPVIAMRLSR